MKRKPIFAALTLLLVVGAALWGVNYRSDHPPLTQADKEFHALVAGADRAEVVRLDTSKCPPGSPPMCSLADGETILDAEQTRELIQEIHLVGSGLPISQMPNRNVYGSLYMGIIFLREDEALANCTFAESPKLYGLYGEGKLFLYRIQGRSHKRLNRALDAYLPQRIRP